MCLAGTAVECEFKIYDGDILICINKEVGFWKRVIFLTVFFVQWSDSGLDTRGQC